MANVGSLDRTLRLIAGVILVVSPFLPPFAGFLADLGDWKFVVAAVGLVLLGTALFRFCPAYRLLGIQTCPMSRSGPRSRS